MKFNNNDLFCIKDLTHDHFWNGGEAVKDDLKQILMETAEKEIEPIIEKVSKRVELNISSWPDYLNALQHIKLEWLIKKEE